MIPVSYPIEFFFWKMYDFLPAVLDSKGDLLLDLWSKVDLFKSVLFSMSSKF